MRHLRIDERSAGVPGTRGQGVTDGFHMRSLETHVPPLMSSRIVSALFHIATFGNPLRGTGHFKEM